jgi:hypothetical protein
MIDLAVLIVSTPGTFNDDTEIRLNMEFTKYLKF